MQTILVRSASSIAGWSGDTTLGNHAAEHHPHKCAAAAASQPQDWESIISGCAGDIALADSTKVRYSRAHAEVTASQPHEDWESIISGCAGDIPASRPPGA